MATTRSDYDRVRAQARRDLSGTCVLWDGATTGSGVPRTTLNGKYVDARRVVWQYLNGGELDGWTRFRSLCGNRLCIADECVSYVGDGRHDDDFVTWACVCGNGVRVLPMALEVWCPGTSNSPHPARRMRRCEAPVTASAAPALTGTRETS